MRSKTIAFPKMVGWVYAQAGEVDLVKPPFEERSSFLFGGMIFLCSTRSSLTSDVFYFSLVGCRH